MHALDSLIVKLQDVDRIRAKQGWSQRLKYTESHVLLVVTHGEGLLQLEHGEYLLSHQRVYSCGPKQTYGIREVGAAGLEVIILRFNLYQECASQPGQLEIWREEAEFLKNHHGRLLLPGEKLISLCESMDYNWQSGQELGRYRCQLEFQNLLYDLVQSQAGTQKEDSLALLERTKAYIEGHFTENLTLERLSAMAGFSQSYYVDLFKKRYGMSAMEYMTQLRMDKAKRLMAVSNLKLRDIAHQIGYQDEFYFSRKFKKEVGVSPSVYMKKRCRKIAAYSIEAIGYLLALDIVPYAAPLHPKWTGYYYQHYGKDIPVHMSAYRKGLDWESNISILREAAPDLIISLDNISAREKELLEAMGEVHYISAEISDWREQLLRLAVLLGEEKQADRWLSAFASKVHTAKTSLAEAAHDRKTVVLRIEKEQLYAYCSRATCEIFYGELGFSAGYSGNDSMYNDPITVGSLHLLEADYLLVMVRQEDLTLAYWRRLCESPEWQSLKAVRHNQLFMISPSPWLEYSPMGQERIVEEVSHLFIGK
ncbi:AraC family transcriptional regulator [Paenibacillus sp. CAA11]|uniref:AraC family transcriptional regulator n=1 Tax=Paenibacillus sp. CAA11 TaxID=1532905 RepID=UPI000D35481E|nr:AraC family transcriptional regulator [Paenibacillus sp. CAA11]AWB43786.1 AraC family transcriptional regulator [Paenibacillus sp. CAA11]